MSDIERFRRERRVGMKKFLVDVKKYVDHTIEMIDTADIHTGEFDEEVLRSMASTMEEWRVSFQEVERRQQRLESKINQLK
jgi:hypothetical protein